MNEQMDEDAFLKDYLKRRRRIPIAVGVVVGIAALGVCIYDLGVGGFVLMLIGGVVCSSSESALGAGLLSNLADGDAEASAGERQYSNVAFWAGGATCLVGVALLLLSFWLG